MNDGLYRAFTDQYRAHLDQHGGPPSEATLKHWFKEQCRYTGGVTTHMRRGTPVPEKYLIAFVALLVAAESPNDDLALRRARRTTLEFLARFGVTELTPATAPAILAHICYPPAPRAERTHHALDYLRRPILALGEFVDMRMLDSHVRGCPDGRLEEAVKWMYTRVAQDTPQGRPNMPIAEVNRLASGFMGLSAAEYVERARRWARAFRWTVVLAWHKNEPLGMSIVLPVTPQAYQEILDGKRTPYDCTSNDLMVPSTHLVIEAAAERPEFVGRARPNPTQSLRIALLFQIGALARCNRLHGPQTLRILSFAGTPTNELRLRDTGFLPTGRTLPRPKVSLFEFRLEVGHLAITDLFNVATLYLLGALGPPSPRMADD